MTAGAGGVGVLRRRRGLLQRRLEAHAARAWAAAGGQAISVPTCIFQRRFSVQYEPGRYERMALAPCTARLEAAAKSASKAHAVELG